VSFIEDFAREKDSLALCLRILVWESLTNEDSAVQRVGVFEDLQADVGIDVWRSEPGAHGCLRRRTVLQCILAFDKGTEPGADKEDFAVLLDVWEGVERLV